MRVVAAQDALIHWWNASQERGATIGWRSERHMADIASISGSFIPQSMAGAQASQASQGAERLRDAARRARLAQSQAAASDDGDDVQFSAQAYFTSKLRNLPIREDLVARVRDEIARGKYDSPDKLDKALDEMIGDHA